MIRIERILYPTDFSGPSGAAVDYACSLAEAFGAELHVLHVVDEVAAVVYPEHGPAENVEKYVELAKNWASEQLEAVPGPERAARLRVVKAVRSGVPFQEIVRYATENGCDLIVLGTHGRSGISHFFLGSVAERVARSAACPVLTVRPRGDEGDKGRER